MAYEPVWANGVNGIPAASGYAEAHQAEFIDVAKAVLSRNVLCLYGGSANPQNCTELIQRSHIFTIDGPDELSVDKFLEPVVRSSKSIFQINQRNAAIGYFHLACIGVDYSRRIFVQGSCRRADGGGGIGT